MAQNARVGIINATILLRSNLLRAGQMARLRISRQHGMIKRGALAQLPWSRVLVATSQSLLDGRRVTLFFSIDPPARILHSFYKYSDHFGFSSSTSP